MKKIILITFLLVIHINIWGQPSPCAGKSISLIENIKGISFDKTNIYMRNIRLKPNYNHHSWNNIITKDSLSVKNIELYEVKIPKYCDNLIYKSGTESRFYFSYPLIDEIIVIQNGKQKMYLVFPSLNSIESNYFFGTIIDSISKINIVEGKRAYYNPNRYISNIKFKEGIFFIKDYYKRFSIKSFERNDVTEFFPDNDIYDYKNPKNHWKEKVHFISLFDEKIGPEYSKIFPGYYTENQVTNIIVKNHPRILNNILKSTVDNIKLKSNKTEYQRDLFEIWSLLRSNVTHKEFKLLQEHESKEISIDDIYKEYKDFQETEFFSILESDFNLTLKYYKYFIDENSDIKEFIDFAKANELKFDKEQLEQFIDDKK